MRDNVSLHIRSARLTRSRGWLLAALTVLGLALTLASWPAARASEPLRLHEARLVYRLDRSAVPAWVAWREVTLVVTVGPAMDVVVRGDGVSIPCDYDGQRAAITTDADEIEVTITAPTLPLSAIGAASLAALRGDKAWALSYTLDDGFTSQATTAKRLLDRYGYRAAIAIIGPRIGTITGGKPYATAEELQAVVAAGWPLANHTSSHLYAGELGGNDAVVNDILATNRAIAAAVPGYAPTMFTAPFTDPAYTPIVAGHLDELGLHLIQAVGYEGRDVDDFRSSNTSTLSIGRTQILSDGSQYDQVQAWLAANPGRHLWLSLHTHDVAEACDCVETSSDILHRTYGAAGLDNVWMAPAPEVYAYLVARQLTTVTELSREMIGEPMVTMTPAPTATPARYTMIFQQGAQGYGGARDTYIDSYSPTSSYGGSPSLLVRTQNKTSALLHFDVSQLPADAQVERATLRLYGLTETNASTTCLDAYPLLRPWDGSATWNQARVGDLWGEPGAAAAGADRAAARSGLTGLAQGVGRWYDIEIADAAQTWASAPANNYGVALVGSGQAARQVTLASAEYGNAALRPALFVTYTLPIAAPTLTPAEGNGMLVAQVLLEGRSDSAATPVTATIARSDNGALVFQQALTLGEDGQFIAPNLAAGRYDITVTNSHTLRVVRRGLEIRDGLNMAAIGPLVEGDVVRDGLINARDWHALTAAFGAAMDEPAYSAQADLNDDGRIDVLDVALLFSNYGRFGDVVQVTDPGGLDEPPIPDARLWIAPANGQVGAGHVITLTVMLDVGAHAANGADFWVEFDPRYLHLRNVAYSDVFPTFLPGNEYSAEQGYVHFVAGNLNTPAPVSSTVALVELGLEARELTPPGGVTVRFSADPSRPHSVPSQGYNVLAGSSDAVVTVGAGGLLHLPLLMMSGSSLAARAPSARSSYEGAMDLPIVASYSLRNPTVQARDVRAHDGRAYLALSPFYSDPSFVYVLDVTDPLSPTLMTTVNGYARDPDEIWLEGDRALVAKKGNGVDILDISNPALIPTPGTFLWTTEGPPIAKGLHAVGNRLYIADERYGLQIVDTTNYRSPVLMGSYDEQMFGEGVWCDGSIAYVAADRDGQNRPVVYALNVSNPYRPTFMHLLIPPIVGRAVDVQVTDGYLYIAAEHGGVAAFDVTEPDAPVFVGAFDTEFAEKVDAVGRTLYVADGGGGLVVLDASTPSAWRVIGQADTPGYAYGVSVMDGHAYVADGASGLQVVALAGLTPTPTASPTPTNTPTATPTDTPTMTATPSPTATPTRAAAAIPLVLK